MRRIAAVVLFDERGRLLLQERDEWAPRNPLTWSPVGGGVEAGEDDLTAATRELAEETELTGQQLVSLGELSFYCSECAEVHVGSLFTGFTDATNDDVVCHEGRQIVFVEPTTIHTLAWSPVLAVVLPRVVGSATYVERFGRPEPHEFGCVLLVDAVGRVLLQERDEHAPIDPDRWGLSGGHLEPGEDPEVGARRELEEETGVRLEPGVLQHFATVEVFHPTYGSVDQVHVFAAGVDLTDADIDCHEGRQIVFVPPHQARKLSLTMTGVLVVPRFLGSAEYRALTER